MSHECPAEPCTAQVEDTMFACRPHWYALPKKIRDDIWAGYTGGDAEAHKEAMIAAAVWYRENGYG